MLGLSFGFELVWGFCMFLSPKSFPRKMESWFYQISFSCSCGLSLWIDCLTFHGILLLCFIWLILLVTWICWTSCRNTYVELLIIELAHCWNVLLVLVSNVSATVVCFIVTTAACFIDSILLVATWYSDKHHHVVVIISSWTLLGS